MKFFQRLKYEVWKVLRGFLLLALIGTIVLTVVNYGKKTKRPDRLAMIIDTDSGYGADDLFAITRVLIEPGLNPEALLASQYNQSEGSNDSTMLVSHRLNGEILLLHGFEDIPCLTGSMNHTGYSGNPVPRPSPASRYILDRARAVPYGQKIDIVTLGPVTNLATALLTDSTLAGKIRWYGLGLKFDHKDRIWNKNEFNARNDLDAMDYLLNLNSLETHIMPANVAASVFYHRRDAMDLLEGRGYKWDLLLNRFSETCPGCTQIDLSSLMLIEAILNPDHVTEKKFKTPPENTYRDIYVYTWIDGKKVLREFRNQVAKAMN